MSVAQNPGANSNDAMIFGLFVAIAVHLLFLFGVGFAAQKAPHLAPTLKVTLAKQKDLEAPDEADFIAQHNQQGSGSKEKLSELTTDTQAMLDDTRVNEIFSRQAQKAADYSATEAVSSSDSTMKLNIDESEAQQIESQTPMEVDQQWSEISSLRARLDQQRQAYAKRPRKRTLTAESARAAEDAAYLLAWSQRVESVGNEHYPAEARRDKLEGDLRLLVSLRPDGTIHETTLLQSSGHRVLDAAALKIVHLASPFDPFPANLRDHIDRLEIIRTWRFSSDFISTN